MYYLQKYCLNIVNMKPHKNLHTVIKSETQASTIYSIKHKQKQVLLLDLATTWLTLSKPFMTHLLEFPLIM